jgi:O-antigen/teichoic acid export membrane protein
MKKRPRHADATLRSSAAPPQFGPKTSRLAHNVISNWGAYFGALVVSFFLSPHLVSHLGNAGYGVWTLLLSLTGYLGLLDLGVRGAVTRYLAKFHAEADDRRASEVASSALAIFGTSGLVAISVSLALAFLAVNNLHIPPQYLSAARLVVLLTGLSIALSLVGGVFGGILTGLQRFELINGVEISMNLLRALAIVTALRLGRGLVTLAVIQLSITLARCAINVALARRLYPELRIRLSAVDRATIKLIFSFSIFSSLLHMSSSLIYASDNVVIGAYLPVAAVTFYVIGGNLVEYARQLSGGLSQTMTPLASSIEARGPAALQDLVLQGGRWASMIILPVTCTFLLRGGSFIGLWQGQQYAGISGRVLIVLSLTMIFSAPAFATCSILLGLSRHKPIVPAMLAEALCNLALSVFLVKRIGIIGVAWGTAIPSLASSLIFWPWYIRRSLGIRPHAYLLSTWIRPAVALIPFLLGTYAVERFWPTPSLLVFFSQVAFVLLLVLPGYWLICLTDEQRRQFSQRWSEMLAVPEGD